MAKTRKASEGIAALLVRELSSVDAEAPNAGWVKNLSETYDSAREAEETLFGIWVGYLSEDKAYDKFQELVTP